MSEAPIVLRTHQLSRRFGELRAVDGVDLQLPRGARHALIGPNGAGKTTLINLLTGVLAPSAGDVYLGAERVTQLRQFRRVKLGLARTFQINSLFPGLTVLESVTLAVLERRGAGARWWRGMRTYGEDVDEARDILATLKLQDDAERRTATLPYGRQRLVEIALALATRPRILLLDEPAAGIPSAESVEVLEALANLPPSVTILFIEHDMGLVFRFAARVTVLVAGRVLTEGAPDEIRADERVRAVYLGKEHRG